MGFNPGLALVVSAAVGLTGSPALAPAPGTARNVPDWSRLARDIVTELTVLRVDPPAYARHLEKLLPRFTGNVLRRPGRLDLDTDEGAPAVREAIEVLRRTPRLSPLRWSDGMAAGAADHVRDQGPVGGLEHDGRDRSTPGSRVNRYGRWRRGVAENMAFGENPARDVVIQLLVDDGVPDRGHRATILDPGYAVAGAACGPHRRYRQMCVIDFAAGYEEGRTVGR